MDYQALAMLVPKLVGTWSSIQVRKWLHFIHMQKLIPLFEKQSINGQSIININTKILSNMGIKSNIMQKKLMIWIEKGLKQFNDYIDSNRLKQNECPNIRKTSNQTQKRTVKNNDLNNDNYQKMQIQEEPPREQLNKNNKIQNINRRKNDIKLKISNYQGPQSAFYIVSQKGIKFGRGQHNDIKTLQISVQNNHAEIKYQNGYFYLYDLGSQFGTFTKINFKIELLPQMLIEMGTYLILVDKINGLKQIILKCINTQKNTSQDLVVNLQTKPSYTLGRKGDYPTMKDDQHLSSIHAKIYFLNGKFILQDMASTNGTWLRLSSFKQKSKPYKIRDGQIIKIGNTITYACTYESQYNLLNTYSYNNRMQVEDDNSHICMKCGQNQRNILFLPCKHKINCEKCSEDIQECPLCNHSIQEKILLYVG